MQGRNAAGETQVPQVHVQPENDAHNVQPAAENTEDIHIPDGEPLPTQESTFDNADHFQSQTSSAMPPSVNENQNVNLNVNVNLNIDSVGIDGNTMFSQTTNNVVHPSSETEQMHQGSPARPATSGKRVKRTAGRKFIARKSPRLAAASASASVQAPKPKLQRALWKP
ncbi:uncharacterized protein LOC133708033 [Rosa rugosa]|uniref:uncharacterized protein LOC133708033 n=1 Tax=Rosa rugosa TaxID=74645 RepID=UPI002B40E4EF|nr:uncharacterized protein LOC133708033 [Rosa rugosa]